MMAVPQIYIVTLETGLNDDTVPQIYIHWGTGLNDDAVLQIYGHRGNRSRADPYLFPSLRSAPGTV